MSSDYDYHITPGANVQDWRANALDIAREILPGWPNDALCAVIWERTGWPSFWRGDTPAQHEQHFRAQLAAFAAELDADRQSVGDDA